MARSVAIRLCIQALAGKRDSGTNSAIEAELHSRPLPMPNATAERKVLLAIREGYLDPRLLTSARSLCQRLGAELDILLLAAGEALPPEVADLVRDLRSAGVMYTLTRKPQLRRRDVVQYANSHECIVSVVIDSLEGWEAIAEDKNSDPWRKLACPLVTAAPAKPRENNSK